MRAFLLHLLMFLAAPAMAAEPSGTVFDHPATAESFAHDLRDATQTLKGAKTLRGKYTQDKQLSGVPKPLHAEGSFVFVKDLGIAWLTTKPFESELVITGSDIIQRENGKVSMHLSAAEQPAVHIVSEIFEAVFGLDFERLSASFDLYSRRLGKGWELGLKPREANGALRDIVVAGDREVRRVLVNDANGDSTDIRLKASVVSSSAPAAEELRRFSP